MIKLKNIVKELIHIRVVSEYWEQTSDVESNQYAFKYQITIDNQSPISIQLLRRHWIITDANGENSHVEGEGVVGEQPQIKPSQSFTYQSHVVLSTPVGSMHGDYQMQQEDGQLFHVIIPAFSLAMPSMIH